MYMYQLSVMHAHVSIWHTYHRPMHTSVNYVLLPDVHVCIQQGGQV